MSVGLDILGSTTNYFRLAKVRQVKYVIYRAEGLDDQSLLDAEIELRRVHPKVLSLLYSKELWTFSFNDDDPPVPDAKFSLTASPVKTFSPQNMMKNTSGTSSTMMIHLCTTFTRAVKKLLLITLTLRKEIIPFGSASLLTQSSHVLHIEPKVVESGDLLVSLTTKAHNLIPLNDIPHSQEDINTTHSIYLAPSGIRVYLTGTSIGDSSTPMPSNAASIADSLETLHGIHIDHEKCTWVKLIPNLSHLNSMTSPIADFFKPVPNSKFLVWPVELCVAQPAEHIRETEHHWIDEVSDPLSLIDKFVELKATASTKTPSNVPTSNNTPADFDLLHHAHNVDTPTSKPTPEQHLAIPTNAATTTIYEEEAELNSTKDADDWDDLDAELFGGDEVGEPDFDFFGEEKPNNGTNDDLIMLDDDAELHADLASELEMLAGEDSDDGSKIDSTAEPPELKEDDPEDPYDIPLHEMTLPATPPYVDPGAPLPVQSPKTATRKKSIFSPLNFNPIIKSNVDNKYANGGKFHVSSVDTPPNSDSGIPSVADETFGKDEGDDDDSEDESDSEYEDDGDDEEDEMHDMDDRSRKSTSSGDTTNDSPIQTRPLAEGSMEPETKKVKTGTPSISSLDAVITEKAGSLSPGVVNNGTPNIIPFLLRTIPLYTIPSHIYTDCPKLNKEQSELIDLLVKQVVWDDGCLSDVIPREEEYAQEFSDDTLRAIAQTFPDFHSTTLAEYAGVPYVKPIKSEAESPLAAFKAPDYSQGLVSEYLTMSPQKDHEEESKSCFLIPPPKVKVKRLNQEISVNASAVHLWNTMSFESLKQKKDFRVLMVSPVELVEQSGFFLTSLSEIYEKSHLGSVEKMQLASGQVNNGVLPVDFESSDFQESVLSPCRMLNQALLKGMNYKEILVVLPDYDEDLKSTVDNIQLFHKISETLLATATGKQLQLKVNLKIIPGTFITNNGVFSVLSINRLTRLALSLYSTIGDPDVSFTALSSPPPSQIRFQLTEVPVAEKILAEDSFIHLAYERSTDKEWCVAAWTDNKFSTRKVKAWTGSTKTKDALEKTMDEIWDITTEMASKLPGRKYLVLTRLNGMIADDELLQLKRLSSKSKDLTLMVACVNHHPRLLLEANDIGFPFNKLFNQDDGFNGGLAASKLESAQTVGSSTGMTPSTIFTPQPVNSPDLFTMGKGLSTDSPSDTRGNDEGSVIEDIGDCVHGVITEYVTPLANSPGRVSVRTGLLVKPIKNSNNKLEVFEVNMLSCPSTFSSWDMMRTLLIQLRNLATMAEIHSVVEPSDSLVPWHVAAVEKAIKCLVHVRVENPPPAST